MLVKAVRSFAGKVSMYAGEVRDIADKEVLHDLLRAGHVEPEAQEAEIVEKPVEKPAESVEKSTKKTTRKTKKKTK